jgi:phosphomethylpyrimidine synthase
MCGPKFCSMKISAEVREFARLNPLPSEGEGASPSGEAGEGASSAVAEAGMAGAETSAQVVDAGFAQMSKRFHETGVEIYVPSAD